MSCSGNGMVEEKKMKIRGYCCGQPIFESAEPVRQTRAEVEAELAINLDCVVIFPNGRRFFEYVDGEYFMPKDPKDEDSGADISLLYKIDENGDVVSKRSFDVFKD